MRVWIGRAGFLSVQGSKALMALVLLYGSIVDGLTSWRVSFMDSIPTHIGKYELVGRLGQGGMGAVYKAFHPQLQRYVAIKFLLTGAEAEPDFIARFEQEARLVARLRHPHIVQVFDYDVADGKPYMVMEYVEGETLADRIASYHRAGQLMPVDEVVAYFQQLCAAVDYAHRQGMLHRDIKPRNVLLNKQNEAILTDFGLAKIAGVSGMTSNSVLVGTPHYMSPEQGQGLPVDGRSDVYSLSVMLYTVLAGRLPFDGQTPVAVIMQHVTAEPPPIESINPGVLPALAQVAMIGMGKKPEERFQTAAALGSAITHALEPGSSPSGATHTFSLTAPSGVETILTHVGNQPPGGGPAGPGSGPAYAAAQAGERPLSTHLMQATPPNQAQPDVRAALLSGSPVGPSSISPLPLPAPPAKRRIGRLAAIGIIVALLLVGSIVLAGVLLNRGGTGVVTVGTVTFTDSDANDFSHPADTLTANLSKLNAPAGGTNYFAWLCPSDGSSTCTLLGAVQVQSNGSAALKASPTGKSLLGVTTVSDAQLAIGVTFKITQEPNEVSAPPAAPSNHIVYAGSIAGDLLAHIRHQIVAFPRTDSSIHTALDTGFGQDAALLAQLSQQLKANQSHPATMQVLAEEIYNLIAGPDAQHWVSSQPMYADGDDQIGMDAGATVQVQQSACTNPQNSSYLPGVVDHAHLAAEAGKTQALQNLYNKMLAACQGITPWLLSIQKTAQQIAQNPDGASQADINTLVDNANNVLNGWTSESQHIDGARQMLTFSEQMATISVTAH